MEMAYIEKASFRMKKIVEQIKTQRPRISSKICKLEQITILMLMYIFNDLFSTLSAKEDYNQPRRLCLYEVQ
jgi:hypothetical protein